MGLIGIRILHFLAVSEEEKLINFRFLTNRILGFRLDILFTLTEKMEWRELDESNRSEKKEMKQRKTMETDHKIIEN